MKLLELSNYLPLITVYNSLLKVAKKSRNFFDDCIAVTSANTFEFIFLQIKPK